MRPRLVEGGGPTTLRLALWVVGLLVLVGVVVGAWYIVRYTTWGRSAADRAVVAVAGERPGWMQRGNEYAWNKAATNGVVPDDGHAQEHQDLKRILAELKQKLDALERRPQTTLTQPMKPAEKPPEKKRAPMLYVVNDQKPPERHKEPRFRLTPGTWIPCTVETTLNSEIEGYFTVKTKRHVADSATGAFVLIPQGQSIVAKDTTSELLFGNERIPTFALTMSLPDASEVDLGQAPIMDATGTNGLTGKVDNHIWRLVWTSIFIGGLRGGQQVVQQEMASTGGLGALASGVTSQGAMVTQRQLGRAQDTRPTIHVSAGEACNILVTKGLSLPVVAQVR
jgi:type IV secretory pathway VirB10-like protein